MEQSRSDRSMESGAIREGVLEPDARHSRRARLPGSAYSGIRGVQRLQGEGTRCAARLLSRREPLGPETEKLARVESGSSPLAGEVPRRLRRRSTMTRTTRTRIGLQIGIGAALALLLAAAGCGQQKTST